MTLSAEILYEKGRKNGREKTQKCEINNSYYCYNFLITIVGAIYIVKRLNNDNSNNNSLVGDSKTLATKVGTAQK